MAPGVAATMRKKIGAFGGGFFRLVLGCLVAFGPAAANPAHAAMSNTARATGTLPDGTRFDSETGTVDVVIVGARPAMTLEKTASLNDGGDGRADAGDVVTYTFTLRNIGNITLQDIAISDPLEGVTIVGNPVATLAPGQTNTSISATYELTQGDIDRGNVPNQATATARIDGRTDPLTALSDDDNGATDSNGDNDPGNDPTIMEIASSAAMTVEKTGSTAEYNAAGDTVEFSIRIANTGNVTLNAVTPLDELAQSLVCPSGLPVPALAPGASETCTATHVVTEDHMRTGKVADSVSVTATTPTGASVGPVTDSAEISISTATVAGRVFLDRNGNGLFDPGTDQVFAGYAVELVNSEGDVVMTVTTQDDGSYQFENVLPAKGYSVIFRNTEGKVIGGIANMTLAPGETTIDQDMPIDPSGVVYDSVTGQPVAGALVTMTNAAGTPLPPVCFVDGAQQDQVTSTDGGYRFDVFPGKDALCPTSETEFRITVRAPAGYASAPSSTHPPLQGPLDVTACVFDANPGGTCEPASEAVPPSGPATLPYVLAFLLEPGDPNVIHNHIPLDPFSATSNITITKVAGQQTIRRGERVSYTINVANRSSDDAGKVRIVDRTPPGFAYVEGSASINGTAFDPQVTAAQIDFGLVPLGANQKVEIVVTLQSLASAGPGEYVNRADVSDENGASLAPTATAVVELVAEPVFDCSDVIGKVFQDANGNGYQDAGEKGLAGVRLATVRGELITTDRNGRFNVPCADMPEQGTGSNFILKLDERTLPTGFRLTTENPRVVRLTPGKMVEMNFGAAAGREIRLDLKDEAFIEGAVGLAPRWGAGLDRLIAILEREYSYLTVVYRTGQSSALASARMKAFKEDIHNRWRQAGAPYELEIDIRREQN